MGADGAWLDLIVFAGLLTKKLPFGRLVLDETVISARDRTNLFGTAIARTEQ
jgi:hypothetical protein